MAGNQTSADADNLRHQAWVAELQSQQGFQQVVTAGALLANNTLLPPDHMVSPARWLATIFLKSTKLTCDGLKFTAFLKVNLIRDMLCLFSNSTQQFATIVTLGSNICGHPKVRMLGLACLLCNSPPSFDCSVVGCRSAMEVKINPMSSRGFA